jgi:hypothetical protein
MPRHTYTQVRALMSDCCEIGRGGFWVIDGAASRIGISPELGH